MMWRSQANPPMTSPGGFSKLPLLLLVKQVMGAVRERAKRPGQGARSRGWRRSRLCCLCQMFADRLPCVGTRPRERIPATAKIPKHDGLEFRLASDALQIPCSREVLPELTEAEGQSRSPMGRISMHGFCGRCKLRISDMAELVVCIVACSKSYGTASCLFTF